MAKPKVTEKCPGKSTTANTERVVKQLEDLTAACGELRRKVPAGPALSTADRQASSGKFRDGEAAVLVKVLDVVDAHPELFSVLAAHDGGTNPGVVETAHVREAIERKIAADRAVAAAELLAKALRDYALVTGEEIREVTSPAYAIIKINASIDASLRDAASEPITYYRDSSRTKSSKAKT
jgi:hypothetical protein